ncbi:MAG: OmpA family protein, partial [Bacteroidota bacterium]
MKNLLFIVAIGLLLPSCVSKKKFLASQDLLKQELEAANTDLGKLGEELNASMKRLAACESDKSRLQNQLSAANSSLELRQEQITDLRGQVDDARKLRDQQLSQVEDLTALSQTANDGINQTLSQLQQKDKYIQLLQQAKTRADSINLALAVNLKSVLSDGIEDEDVEVKVDKTVVFVNLSDKMLFQSGSSNLTSRAGAVLGKIAQIVQSRPELEVMVEGYTDNVPISNSCVQDNWDLSVKRATSVVRVLQKNYGVNPDRLIAAGRGEYSTLADNST